MTKVLLLCVIAAHCSMIASASPIQYGTAGVFSGCTDVANQVSGCSAAGNTVIFGTDLVANVGLLLTYIGVPNSTNVNSPTAASFGDIVFSCLGGGISCSSLAIPANLVLTINISQVVPTLGGPTGIPSATVAGSVSGTSNSAVVTWPVNNTINIGTTSYRIANNPLNLVPPSSSNGDTTVQGLIVTNAVPEPTSLSMIGAALAVYLVGHASGARRLIRRS